MEKAKCLFTRFAIMFIALMCVLGMGTPVFAENPISSNTTGSFTVNGFESVDGMSVTAYQIITVNINDEAAQPEYPMYKWANESIQQWVATYDKTNRTDYIDDNGMVTDQFKNLDAASQTTFLEELTNAIKDGTITDLSLLTPVLDNGSAKFSNMTMGEYLVTANGGVKIYSPTTVKLVPVYDAEKGVWKLGDPVIGVNDYANMKSQDPSITKEVTNPIGQTVSIGDTVTYTLTVTIPDYPTSATAASLSVSDTLGSGLTYNGNDTVKVTVKGTVDNQITEGDGTYSFTESDKLGRKAFEIVFDPIFVLSHGGEEMAIEYTATVNETASNSAVVLKNTASITYSNDPYTSAPTTKESTANVYTYKVSINKYNSAGKLLPNAEFKLTRKVNEIDKDMYFKAKSNNTFTYNSAINSGDNDYTSILSVGDDGSLTIIGLDEGTYTLTETKAPNGYVIPQGSITFTLVKDSMNAFHLGAVTVTPNGEAKLYDTSTAEGVNNGYSTSGDTLTINVQNISKDEADFTLPSTGGMGTLIFTVGGLFVMAGAVVLAVYMYKKRNA